MSGGKSPGAVEAWFGDAFLLLHPLLQQLHRHGGSLSGPLQVDYGKGIAGALGRAIGRRLGIRGNGDDRLQVTIGNDGDALVWKRRFNDGSEFKSRFMPVGRYPTGHWLESSRGPELVLAVDIVDGGWHWRQLASRFHGIALPRRLMARVEACKEIRDGLYFFSVGISLPVVGKVIAYSGSLTAVVA